jgi:4-amino-4-deoxy-L-arabinose transferase-like glycosyltransferase
LPTHRHIIALILLTVITRLPAILHTKAIDDERYYAVVAIEMLEGGLPYLDAIERKPPLLFWTYQAILSLGERYQWYILHTAAVVWTLLSMLGLFLTGKTLFNQNTGLVAALLYSIYQSWALWRNLAFNGELMMNLPIIWGAWLILRPQKRPFSGGLFLGGAFFCAAFLMKQPAAIAAVPFGIYLLLPARYQAKGFGFKTAFLQAAFYSLGFFSLLAAVAWMLKSQGILEEAIYWTIGDHDVPHGLFDSVFWIRGSKMALAFSGACLLLVIGSWMAIRDYRQQKLGLWTGKQAEFIALMLLLLVSLIGTAASGRFYPHYFIQMVPVLCILASPVLAGIWSGIFQFKAWWLQPRFSKIWLSLTVLTFFVAHTSGLYRDRSNSEIGTYLQQQAEPGERIFVWGQSPSVYLDARCRPASRYIATFPLTGYLFGSPLSWDTTYDTSNRIIPGAWDNLMYDLKNHAPRFIVDTDAARPVERYPIRKFPQLDSLLQSRYVFLHQTKEGLIYKVK